MIQSHHSIFFFFGFSLYFITICLCLSNGTNKPNTTNRISSEDIEVGSKDIGSSKFIKNIERDSDNYKVKQGHTKKENSKVKNDKKVARKKFKGYRKLYRKRKIKRNVELLFIKYH